MEAAARDDDQERERLVATCPRRHYVMTEAGFTDRVDAAHDMAVAAALALGPQLMSLRMSAAVRETLPHAVALGVDVGAAGDEGPTSDDVREVVAETLDQALDQAEALLRSEAAAVYAAFSAVCRHEMQLEPEVVLHAAFAPLAVEQLGLEQLDDVEPDEATLVAWLEMLARKWAERIGG